MSNKKTFQEKSWIQDIIENVYRYYNNRRVILWGKCETSDLIREKLKEKYKIEVAFYVDKDNKKQDNRFTFPSSCIYGKSKEYYIVIPLAFYKDIKDELTGGGYIKGVDYYYFSDCIIHQADGYYEDAHGNRIIGEYEGLKVLFCGFDSVIKIGKKAYFANSAFYIHNCSRTVIEDNVNFINSVMNINNDSLVEIKQDCKITSMSLDVGTASSILFNREIIINGDAKWSICNDSKLEIGDRGRFSNGIIRLNKNTLLKIGNDFSVGYNYNFVLYECTSAVIGEDCMFSYNIFLRSNDGHSIFDIKTGKNINSTNEISKKRKVIIGNHVWIGMCVTILYNTYIGQGSIIGAASVVKTRIPNNCIAVGVPAKIIKKDIAWSRKLGAEDIRECGQNYICLTE